MAAAPIGDFVQRICRNNLWNDETDGHLLHGFLTQKEDRAFEALVRRHGPMVLGVCRRVLGHAHDAEDAFQATFLVLVRKAHSLAGRHTIGNWLYGVAFHTALKARAAKAKRRERESQVRTMIHIESPRDEDADWQRLLDQELSRLPNRNREPVVLCDLEGKTRREAARLLNLPDGTLSGRLTTARRLLARRLARRGVALSGGALAATLAQSMSSACVPSPLIVSTVKAATMIASGQMAAGVISANVYNLTEGVMSAMIIAKFKFAAALVIALGLAAGGSYLVAGATPQAAGEAPQERQRGKREPAKDANSVSGALQSVDTDKNTVTINIFSRAEGESTNKTYPVSKDAKITRDGKEAKLADLKNVGRVAIKLSEDQSTAVSITTVARTATGEFFDAGKKTITIVIDTARQGKKKSTFTLTSDTKVTIAGKAAKLADLKEGTTVVLTFSADEANVVQVNVPAAGGRGRKE
jgi:RNA polymerase sigma factor (sigma-70 family)